MDKVSELSSILKNYFGWHKARVDCFAQMLVALFTVRTVNLNELAVAMSSKTQITSRSKRLYRFFAHFEFDILSITHWILKLFFSGNEKVYFAMDRTNWYWGKKPINIFMLSICFEGIAIPVLWKLLPKDGTSSAQERIDFCKRLIDIFDVKRIAGLLGDREFACTDFVKWLTALRIPYYLRIKNDAQVYINKKKFRKASQLFPELNAYEHKVFGMRVEIFGSKAYLTASRNERGELMIVITNTDYKNAISIYLRRWEIESLFQALKGRGFRFEETHMTETHRIEKMIGVLAIAFAWAHKVGEWRAATRPIPLKKFKNQYRPQYSFFRYGLDFIRDAFTGLTLLPKLLKNCLKILENPKQEAIL